MTTLNMIFHVVVSVYRLVKIGTSPQFPVQFRNGLFYTHRRTASFLCSHTEVYLSGPQFIISVCYHNASVNSSSAHPPPPGQSRRWDIRNFIATRGLGICVHRGNPRAFDTHVFESAMDEFSGKNDAFVEQWLVRQGLEKLVNVQLFSQFWVFLHSLEIFNVKNKI